MAMKLVKWDELALLVGQELLFAKYLVLYIYMCLAYYRQFALTFR